MNVNVVSLLKRDFSARAWTNQELAEFYRVESSLIRAGLSVETDHGLSDEGDPWFVFCHAETGDVIIHFARCDGAYVVASPAFDRCMRGANFRSLIEAVFETHPLTVVKSDGSARISIHPAALLVAVVMSCFFKLSVTKAHAGPLATGDAHAAPAAAADHDDSAASSGGVTVDERHSKMVLAAIAFAVTWEGSGAAAESPSPVGPQTADVAEAVAFSSHSGSADAWLNPLDDSSAAFTQMGQASDHAQPVAGALSFGEADDAAGEFSHIHAALQAPSVLTFEADRFDQTSVFSFHLSDAANAAPQGADQGAAGLGWLPTIVNGALGEKGWSAASGPAAAATAAPPDSLLEVDNVLGTVQAATHQVQDLTKAQPQLVVNLVEHSGATPAPQPTAHAASLNSAQNSALASPPSSAAPATPLTADLASALSAPLVITYTISATPGGVASFDLALQNFTNAHPDYQLLSLPKDLIVYDSQLSVANANQANVSNWIFPDGSEVTLVGVAPHQAALHG